MDFVDLSDVAPVFLSNGGRVIARIEELTQNILQDLFNDRSLSIPLRTRSSNQASQRQQTINGNYSFPATSHRSAWRFTVVLAILDIIHSSLISNKIVSKRDIYYQDPALFKSQAVVDKYVDDIAFTFSVSRNDLNIAAEARGLLAGSLSIYTGDGSIDGRIYVDPEGMTIPILSQYQNLLFEAGRDPEFLLLVEKKATFHTLSRASFHTRHHCILLTGQGYPDLATRSLLHYFHTILAPRVPCYALVDFDPDGLSIYNVYTRGSQSLAHERDLAVPNIKLLGLKSEDALPLLVSRAEAESDEGQTIDLPYLSQRERQRAKGLLKRLTADIETSKINEDEQEYMLNRWGWQESQQQVNMRANSVSLRRELQTCLMMGFKVELQILDRRPGGLEGWLLDKLEAQEP